MKIYDYSKAAALKDFFDDEFMERLSLRDYQLSNIAFRRGKFVHKKFVRTVFSIFMKAVLQDCIDNDVKFLAPGRYWFYIYIKTKTENELRRIALTNVYKKVNLIQSDFNIYQFCFYSIYLPQKDRYRDIRISYDKYHEMVDKVNEGKRYVTKKRIRRFDHYIPALMEAFPDLGEKKIRMIVREGCYRIQEALVVKQKDLRMKNTSHKFSMTFYKFKSLSDIRKSKKRKCK